MTDSAYQFLVYSEFETQLMQAILNMPAPRLSHWAISRFMGLVIKRQTGATQDIQILADSAYLGFAKTRIFQLRIEPTADTLEQALRRVAESGFFKQLFAYFFDNRPHVLSNYDDCAVTPKHSSDVYVLTGDLLTNRAADQKHVSLCRIGDTVVQEEIHNMSPLRWIRTLDGVHDLNGKKLSAQIAASEDNFFGSVGIITVTKGDADTVAVSVSFTDENRRYQFYLTEPQACRIALPAPGDVVDEPYDFVYRGLLVPEVEVAPVA